MRKGRTKVCLSAFPTSCVSHRGRYCQSRIRKSSPTCQSAGKHFVVKLIIKLLQLNRCSGVLCMHLTTEMEVLLEVSAEETEMSQGCVAYRAGLPQVYGHVSLKLSAPVLFVNPSLSISDSSLLLICPVLLSLTLVRIVSWSVLHLMLERIAYLFLCFLSSSNGCVWDELEFSWWIQIGISLFPNLFSFKETGYNYCLRFNSSYCYGKLLLLDLVLRTEMQINMNWSN